MAHSFALMVKKCVSGLNAGALKKRQAPIPRPDPRTNALNSNPVRNPAPPASSATTSAGLAGEKVGPGALRVYLSTCGSPGRDGGGGPRESLTRNASPPP